MKNHNREAVIVKAYMSYVRKNRRLPTLVDLRDLGISREVIRQSYNNLLGLHQAIKKAHSEELSALIFNESDFTDSRFRDMEQVSKKYKRFLVTTAVVEKPVHTGFLGAMKNYCKRNKAMLLILPCADMASRGKEMHWNLDATLRNEHVVYKDLSLNRNIFISSIKLSAKHINPLTGLSRIGQRNGSFIYASPKQALEFVATHNKGIPHALMTTGAVTVPDYSTDRYMSERTSYIAENDHVMGAIVVEVENAQTFHFRQIQANPKTGQFIDLGIQYSADGNSKKVAPEALIPGDWHSGETDQDVRAALENISRTLKPKVIVLHDFFDGASINHHDMGKIGKKARKALMHRLDLESEFKGACQDLNDLHSWFSGDLVVVKSNHDEFLERYLTEGRYVEDPQNHYLSLKLAQKQIEGQDPLRYAVEELYGIQNPDRMIWLKRDDEFKICGIECGAHGDKGANGAKGSLGSLEKAYGSCVIGHAHTAAILRQVFRVGTSSRLDLDYAVGPSSWTHTHCLVYPDGSRQLINVIDGRWQSQKI